MDEELLKLRGDHKISTKEMIKRSLPYLKQEWKNLLLAGILIILNVLFDSISPLVIQRYVDFLKQDSASILQQGFTPLLILAISYLLINLVNQGFLYIESITLQKAGQRIVYKIRLEVFEHIESMSLDQFNEMPVGSLVTRVANYTQAMSNLFTSTLVTLIRNVLSVITIYIIMLTLSWQLALVLLGFITLVIIISVIFTNISAKLYRKERAQLSEFNTYIDESLSGMKITQLFNQEERKRKAFISRNNSIWKTRYKIITAFGIYRPIVNFFLYASIAVIFIFGLKMHLTAGTIVAFYLYIDRFYWPIQEISDQIRNVQRARTAEERLFNLMDVEPKATDKENAIEMADFKGKIEFKHVWFAYEKDNWVLKDVSFLIDNIDTCAFVGATGSGKTTILSLIVRNYVPQKGQILIDDVDINDLKIDSLRRNVGQMLQDVFLFSGNIEQNITLFDETISKDRVEKAIKYVNADKFINNLDNGLNQQVVERGENLSQGQRQLLSFARTIVHKPQILILDEATANIDTETEVLIQDSLEKMKSIGTMLVVAHRLSTIQNADQIICLQNGRVVEIGNHQQLLKNKGYYFNLYRLQFKEKFDE